MPILFTRKQTKHENTQSPPFLYDMEMAADEALILREPYKFLSHLEQLRADIQWSPLCTLQLKMDRQFLGRNGRTPSDRYHTGGQMRQPQPGCGKSGGFGTAATTKQDESIILEEVFLFHRPILKAM